MNGSLIAALQTIADFPCAAQDNMPAANMRKIARDALDSFRQHHEQAEGAQGEREAAIAKFAETCPMTAESAAGGKPYDIELRRYYLLGWDDRAALAQPSPKCATCDDNGRIGGPSFYAPDEGGEPCPDCTQPPPAPDQSEVQLGMAELERPDVVAWLVTGVHPNHSAPHAAVDRNGQSARALADHWAERGCAVEIMPLMTVAQHARAVAKWADLFNRAQDSADAARAKVPELERPEMVVFSPYRHHAEKIRQRVEEAASVYEAGGSALGYMEDIAESALIVRNGLDELSAQHDRIVGALRYNAELYDEVWELVTGKGYMNVTTAIAKLEAERDAALEKVAELEKQKEFGHVFVSIKEGYKCFEFDEYSHAYSFPVGEHQLYAAPVARAGQVPEGWKLAPIDPSPQMTFIGQSLRYDAANSIGEIYRQMLAAAPQPAGGE